jgi:hypothetical protein
MFFGWQLICKSSLVWRRKAGVLAEEVCGEKRKIIKLK